MKCYRTMLLLLLLLSAGIAASAKKPGQSDLDSLLREIRLAKADTGKVALLITVSGLYAVSNPREGLRYATEALRLSQKLEYETGIAEAYNSIGINYQAESILDTADQYFRQALRINTRTGYKNGIAKNLNNIGLTHYMQSDYPKALDYWFRSLKAYEELNDRNGTATALGNIGSLYQAREDYANALKYDTLALNKYIELGDREGAALQLGNIGNVYESLGMPDKAISYDLAAVRICEETGNKTGIARNLNNLSNLYNAQDDYAKTLSSLQRALQLQQETAEQGGMATSYLNLGGLFLKRAIDKSGPAPVAGIPEDKNACLDLAISYTRKGIAICSEIGNLQSLSYAYSILTDMYIVKEDYANALDANNNYHIYKDSVFSAENNIRIATLETKRALELKDKQIELDRLAVAKKRNERVYFIAGITLLLWVIGIIFRKHRLQKRLNNLLSIEKAKVEARTGELDLTNRELNATLGTLRAAQEQLIVAEKQKENERIRSRISQDIHDDISSELTRISWVSELAKARMKKDDYAEMPGLLEKITDSSRETVLKLGEIIWTVNPKNDSLGSLLSYMRNHITNFFADTPFLYATRFPDEGTDIPINPELKRNLYLVMKEALNNIAKYSGAGQVMVSFELNGSAYRFCISDDGKGMEPGVVKGGGNGLDNMRRRMAGVMGICAITSEPGKGTQVCCSGELY